jgi:competence protein ComEC
MAAPAECLSENHMLRVHFLNVGHGDCTIIKHPSGRLTMIDINTSQDYDAESFKELMAEQAQKSSNPFLAASGFGGLGGFGGFGGLGQTNSLLGMAFPAGYFEALEKAKAELADPIAFLQNTYPGEQLWRFILSHPDLDHMRGLHRLYDTIGFTNFWDTDHTKEVDEYRSNDDKVDWEFYQALRQCDLRKRYYRGNALFAFGANEYGQPGGDNIEILSPTPALVRSCNNAKKSNDLSMVLRVSHAGKSVLLPGDAEDEAWETMVSHLGYGMKSDYLKASHHGRNSGYNLDAVKLIAPRITFVSVGRKPDTDASSKYRQQCPRVASTRYHGNIELRIHDNGQVQWFVARNAGQ